MTHWFIILLLAQIQREGGDSKRAKLDPDSDTTVSYYTMTEAGELPPVISPGNFPSGNFPRSFPPVNLLPGDLLPVHVTCREGLVGLVLGLVYSH